MVSYRRATADEDRALAEILVAAIDDLSARKGYQGNSTAALDPDAAWQRRRSVWEHLRATADQAWVAEADGARIGYARSIVRGHVRELTELFVLPGSQDAGVGRELLARAMPDDGHHRLIVATTDPRALGRYLRLGLGAHFPIASFAGPPATLGESVQPGGDLRVDAVDAVDGDVREAVVTAVGAVDEVVLGHRRDVDHRWLLTDRRAHLVRRNGAVVGYGYVGDWQGPFAALEPGDLLPLLATAARSAAQAGEESVAFEVPLLNTTVVRHLLASGFRMDAFMTLMLGDGSIGRFDRYVLTDPPIFL